MKVLYSDLQKFVPSLKATPKQVGEVLTWTGFMMDEISEVKNQGKRDFLLSLEVRHNRADGLSVFGIAREVAAYYGLKIKLPIHRKLGKSGKSTMIVVKDKKFTQRVLAYEIDGVENCDSPQWLKEYLALYGMNSKSLLVDLSNYVMLLTGYPSHLLDKTKLSGKLCWDMNEKFGEITTLDSSNIKLTKNEEIILRDDKNILALAGIVGGKKAEIDQKTTSIIAEMGIYNPGTVRKNASNLGIMTEAGMRLSRYLDPNGLDSAMAYLLELIVSNLKNKKLVIKEFSYYPKKYKPSWIKFDPKKPAFYAGVEIPEEKAVKILENLGFKISRKKKGLWVLPPEGRMDVQIEEDLIEEVVRIFGFNKIPVAETPVFPVVSNITPKTLILAEKIQNTLCALGFDEILSPPLNKKGVSSRCNYLPWSLVEAQNPINEEYSEMRQTVVVGLLCQMEEYLKQNLDFINIFEIGKVFGKVGKNYKEHDALGILIYGENSINVLKNKLEQLLRTLGAVEISYKNSETKPEIANPHSCFDIFVQGKKLGIIYKLAPGTNKKNVYFAEANLLELTKLLEKVSENPAVEITSKNLILDANVELKETDSPYDFMRDVKNKIGKKNFFALSIVDVFPLNRKIRYTFRVTYNGLSDQEAKKLHLEVFGLKQ